MAIWGFSSVVERVLCMHEAVGSIPTSSISAVLGNREVYGGLLYHGEPPRPAAGPHGGCGGGLNMLQGLHSACALTNHARTSVTPAAVTNQL